MPQTAATDPGLLYDLNEVADRLHCSRDTILRRVKTGQIKFIQPWPKAKILIPAEEVFRLLQARKAKKTA